MVLRDFGCTGICEDGFGRKCATVSLLRLSTKIQRTRSWLEDELTVEVAAHFDVLPARRSADERKRV